MSGLDHAPADVHCLSATRPLTIVSELIDEMPCGTITLSVPLRDDVIQVGVRDAPGKGLIRVCKWPRTVTVHRVDATPLQVAVTHEPDTSRPPQSALTGGLVFCAPVQTLRLHRRHSAKGTAWHVSVPRANLADPRLLKQFIDTVGAFGSAKQDSGAAREYRCS